MTVEKKNIKRSAFTSRITVNPFITRNYVNNISLPMAHDLISPHVLYNVIVAQLIETNFTIQTHKN